MWDAILFKAEGGLLLAKRLIRELLSTTPGVSMPSNNSFKPRSLRGRGVVRSIVTTPRPQSAPA